MIKTRILTPDNEGIHKRTTVPMSKMQSSLQEELRSISNESAMTTRYQKTADVILIDYSESTLDEAIRGKNISKNEALIQGCIAFISNMVPNSLLSVIIFNNIVRVIFSLREVNASNKMSLINKVASLQHPDNLTNMADALLEAGKQLQGVSSDYLKRVFLISDGIPTGRSPENDADIVKQHAQLLTVGYGIQNDNLDENLMKRLASEIDGKSCYEFSGSPQQFSNFMISSSRVIR